MRHAWIERGQMSGREIDYLFREMESNMTTE
jgi:hypothetical protein